MTNKLAKLFIHAFLILFGTTIFALLLPVYSEGFATVFGVLSIGAFIPFSLITAASLHDSKPVMLGIIAILLLAVWPITDLRLLGTYTLPIGAGILIGQFLRSFLPPEPPPPVLPPARLPEPPARPVDQRGPHGRTDH